MEHNITKGQNIVIYCFTNDECVDKIVFRNIVKGDRSPLDNRLDRIEEVLLMGPGPSCVPDSVYAALGRKTLGHMDPAFIEIMDDVKGLLRTVMQTGNLMTVPISGTGSAGMETCFVNLIEKDDPVLILINGVFGKRMEDVATRLGARVESLEFEWGTPVIPERVEEKLKSGRYKILAVVHAETSTGVRNPVEEIGRMLRGTDTLYLVDAVTSLGGIRVATDEWGVDALYSGSQKCLSSPPGLAPVSFSDRALAAITARKTKVPNWYLDISLLTQYWGGRSRVYHHTAPINMVYAIYQSLFLIGEEGLDSVYRRHLDCHRRLVEGLGALGLGMLVPPDHRLPMLNSIRIPEGAADAEVRSRLRNEHKIEIGAGLGPLAGKIWRIGLMGHTARPENVDRVLGALKQVLGR
jgi:alanine-glyoxylate transaminase/serine-glyoxylate transaminase/serine-pyruvate transaminase